ncbi:hypothetical protein DCCM_3827 [Desulfocucumis palustris]|uniref:Uncharacterized protein n=1 Tax=Desulfocucumis palustris TaxID=1898651 RepID=A0A2L2XED3_9FIRM|nr:hypothetical protein DCCM_3827 [Desulfocucumis palustris]
MSCDCSGKRDFREECRPNKGREVTGEGHAGSRRDSVQKQSAGGA